MEKDKTLRAVWNPRGHGYEPVESWVLAKPESHPTWEEYLQRRDTKKVSEKVQSVEHSDF